MKLTGTAIPVSRGMKVLKRPGSLSLVSHHTEGSIFGPYWENTLDPKKYLPRSRSVAFARKQPADFLYTSVRGKGVNCRSDEYWDLYADGKRNRV